MSANLPVSLLAAILSAACLLAGCQSPTPTPRSETVAAPSTRNNCYSLLHQLLDDEKNVSLLRFIKREHLDVKNLIKKIAKTSGAASTLLEKFAKQDPSINLLDLRLPPGEAATRKSIAAMKQKELLGEKGDQFELTLLLSQAEALSYASHLAKVGAENDLQPERARALTGVSEEMQNLYHEVVAMLLLKTESSGVRPAGTQ